MSHKITIPNLITVFRILLVMAFSYYFLTFRYTIATVIFILASLSDALDGFLARKLNQITVIGIFLDPLADKLMTAAALFCVASAKWIGYFPFIVVAIKESFMICYGIAAYKNKLTIRADIYGKLLTWIFFTGIILTLLSMGKALLLLTIGKTILYGGVLYSAVTFQHYLFMAKKSIFCRSK